MIEVEHVSKRFGRVVALHDVSLSIEPGERVALVGSNGSGKTTLLRSLLGLIRVEGRICISGYDVAKQPELALRELAYVPQISPPLDAPVREVLAAFCRLRNIREKACADCASRLGLSVGAIENTRFRDLSGGMRQKLLAAMALAAQPKILVCDEPTANLDADARAAFLEQIERRPADAVLIVCSHREEDVRGLVTRIITLHEGTVASDSLSESHSAIRLRVLP